MQATITLSVGQIDTYREECQNLWVTPKWHTYWAATPTQSFDKILMDIATLEVSGLPKDTLIVGTFNNVQSSWDNVYLQEYHQVCK